MCCRFAEESAQWLQVRQNEIYLPGAEPPTLTDAPTAPLRELIAKDAVGVAAET